MALLLHHILDICMQWYKYLLSHCCQVVSFQAQVTVPKPSVAVDSIAKMQGIIDV
jgi:hypothetical protein